MVLSQGDPSGDEIVAGLLATYGLSLTNGGGMGICVPFRLGNIPLFRWIGNDALRVRLVSGEFREQNPPGRPVEAKRLGPIRHAGKCLRVGAISLRWSISGQH